MLFRSSDRFAVDSGDLIDFGAVDKLEALGFINRQTKPLPFRRGGGGGCQETQRPSEQPHPNPSPKGEGLHVTITPKGFPLLDAILPKIVAIEPTPAA